MSIETKVRFPPFDCLTNPSMTALRPATPLEYGYFFQLIVDSFPNMERTLERMDLSMERFCLLFWTMGQVYSVCQEGDLLGFCWVEERGLILHLHGIVLKEEAQGNGLGTQILQKIEDQYSGSMDEIELGYHQTNFGDQELYERLGYCEVKTPDAVGFPTMRKNIRNRGGHEEKLGHGDNSYFRFFACSLLCRG